MKLEEMEKYLFDAVDGPFYIKKIDNEVTITPMSSPHNAKIVIEKLLAVVELAKAGLNFDGCVCPLISRECHFCKIKNSLEELEKD